MSLGFLRDVADRLMPWHLEVFALVGFVVFGAMGIFGRAGRRRGRLVLRAARADFGALVRCWLFDVVDD
jgi:hypothetical protein